MNSYYTWNVQALVDWLKAELSTGIKPAVLYGQLDVSQATVQGWMIFACPTITVEQLYAIARYRAWDIDATVAWLGIKPAHLEELLNQSFGSSRIPGRVTVTASNSRAGVM